MFLWTCADMTPHPLVINYSWWQDRKIFGKDFTLAWGLSKNKIRIFRRRKKKNCFLLLICCSSFYFLTKGLRTLPEHMKAGSLLQMRQVHQLIFFWLCDAPRPWHPNIFLTLSWTAFVNYTVSSNFYASALKQAHLSPCQIFSSNWIWAGMLIYYGVFSWNINSDPGNRLGLFSGD